MKKECKVYEFLIAQYIDGEIEEAEKAELLFHLAECQRCRLFWEVATEMKSQAAQEKRLTAPVTLDRRVASIAKQDTSVRKSPRVWRNIVQHRLFLPAPVALVVALLLLLGGAGMAFAWIPRPQSAKEVIEPVVCIKLPTVVVRGDIAQPKPAFR